MGSDLSENLMDSDVGKPLSMARPGNPQDHPQNTNCFLCWTGKRCNSGTKSNLCRRLRMTRSNKMLVTDPRDNAVLMAVFKELISSRTVVDHCPQTTQECPSALTKY
ncbi:hypothetical protein J6590_020712 [Homalodisca vitripennis]|nr:hypothetical protein J6590_020712 [Homalodisca vitripennis]